MAERAPIRGRLCPVCGDLPASLLPAQMRGLAESALDMISALLAMVCRSSSRHGVSPPGISYLPLCLYVNTGRPINGSTARQVIQATQAIPRPPLRRRCDPWRECATPGALYVGLLSFCHGAGQFIPQTIPKAGEAVTRSGGVRGRARQRTSPRGRSGGTPPHLAAGLPNDTSPPRHHPPTQTGRGGRDPRGADRGRPRGLSEGGTNTLNNHHPMPPERTRGGGAAPRRATHHRTPRPPTTEPEGGSRRATAHMPTEREAQPS